MATKITTRSLKMAKINGDYINVNLITSIQENGYNTIIYFGNRNDDNQSYMELHKISVDEVMAEILSQLNGEESKIAKKESNIDKDALDDFIEGI